jgi:hypothetical protein
MLLISPLIFIFEPFQFIPFLIDHKVIHLSFNEAIISVLQAIFVSDSLKIPDETFLFDFIINLIQIEQSNFNISNFQLF